MTFEEALERLEKVVAEMEKEDTGLEASIALYKEGVALSARCAEILSGFEAEVVQLQKTADGNFSEVPFDGA